MNNATPDIRHDAQAQQFSAEIEGQHCELDYLLAGNIMTITHTGVPQAVGGRGIAAALVSAAFAVARSEGWKVIPACSYVAVFMRRHPEYADLLAPRAGR